MIGRNIIILLLFVVGFIFIYMDLYKRFSEKEQKIIYRYIPRIPEDEMSDQIFPSDIFETMFSQPSPWIISMNNNSVDNREINKYFISQI